MLSDAIKYSVSNWADTYDMSINIKPQYLIHFQKVQDYK